MLKYFLIKIRYFNKKDPFKLFYKIIKPKYTKISDKNREIILFTPIRVSPISNLFEFLLAKYFEYKGHQVRMLMCNGCFSYCENVQKNNLNWVACMICQKEQKRSSKYFALKNINVNDLVSVEEKKEIRSLIQIRSFLDRNDFSYNDIDFYDIILSAVMRYSLSSEVKGQQNLLKEYAYTTFLLSQALVNLFKNIKIRMIVSSHGIYSTWGTIIQMAKYYNIPSYVWGRGYIGQGNLLFGLNDNYDKNCIDEGKDAFNSIDLDLEKISAVKGYFSKKMIPSNDVDYINYYNNMEVSATSITFDSLKKIKDKYLKTFVMFTNIPWDGEVFKKTDAFPTTRVFIRVVINWFLDNPDCLLIIRAHPAEVSREEGHGTEKFEDLLCLECPELPANILFLKPDSIITSYQIATLTNIVVLFGSTMSLELAIQKKVIIQAGKNNVSYKGIVYDADTKESLKNYLDLAKLDQLNFSEEMYENALKYGYYWVFQRHIVDDSVVLKKLVFQKYTFDNKMEFLNNKMLGVIYNKMIHNQKILQE